jgi:hypothetical protein
MDIDLPSDWTSILDPSFVKALNRTRNFHDSGFFKFHKADQFLEIILNPVYFGYGYVDKYHSFNACEFRLQLDAEVASDSLEEAADAFEVMKIVLSEKSFIFVFPGCKLDLKVKDVGCAFRFLTLNNGEDYWSLG